MKKHVTVLLFLLCLFPPHVDASTFRFSPNPNKAHLIQWRSWGKEALKEAGKQDKLILLSISAVWCHWCHVMDETTYSDGRVIKYINEHYIPVRVDADLRPDIDSLYNQGGWPSTVILTPKGEILAGDNYVKTEDMLELLRQRSQILKTDREGVFAIGKPSGRQQGLRDKKQRYPGKQDIDAILDSIREAYDDKFGGFGAWQKFPSPPTLDLLMSLSVKTKDPSIRTMITHTLDGMAKGEIHDGVEGGFFRYATRRDWSAPHYEKMLAGNAGLIKNYAEAYLLFGKKQYRQIAEQAIEYVRNNLHDKKRGAFYGSQDAAEAYYKKKNRRGMDRPYIDTTIYTDSSSLMISALAAAYTALLEKEYLAMAEQGADFLIRELYSKRGGMHHSYRDGRASLQGLLADNALAGTALLDLYNVTGKRRYYEIAKAIGNIILADYYDTKNRRFRSFLNTAAVRPVTKGELTEMNFYRDNYRALIFLSRLFTLEKDEAMKKILDPAMATFVDTYGSYFPAGSLYGIALLWTLEEPVEITIIAGGNKTGEFLVALGKLYIPEKVVRNLSPDKDKAVIAKLQYPRTEAAYVCTGKRCSPPIEEPGKIRAVIQTFLTDKRRTR